MRLRLGGWFQIRAEGFLVLVGSRRNRCGRSLWGARSRLRFRRERRHQGRFALVQLVPLLLPACIHSLDLALESSLPAFESLEPFPLRLQQGEQNSCAGIERLQVTGLIEQ